MTRLGLPLNVLLLLLPASTFAFDLQFLGGTNCDGNPVGRFFGNIHEPSGCQRNFTSVKNIPVTAPDGGYNVLLQPEGADSDEVGIAFYGNEDCSTLIGFGNVGTCLGAGNYRSFKVIKLSDATKELQPNLDPAKIQHVKPKATATMKANANLPKKPDTESWGLASSGTGMPGPTHVARRRVVRRKRDTLKGEPLQWDSKDKSTRKRKYKRALGERSAVPGQLTHGDIIASNGQLHRYHQVSKRVFQGIPVEEWNDDLHKRSEEDLPISSEAHVRRSDIETSPNERNVLKREILESKCTLIRTCMITQPNSESLTISAAGDDLLNTISAMNTKNRNDWQFLKDPLAVALVNEAKQLQGYILAQTMRHSEPKNLGVCNGGTTPDERSVLKDTLVQAVGAVSAKQLDVEALEGGDQITDLRVDIKIMEPGYSNPTTNTLFVSTRSAYNKNKMYFEPICESVTVNY